MDKWSNRSKKSFKIKNIQSGYQSIQINLFFIYLHNWIRSILFSC